jgi:hypothetical protein
MTTVFSEARIDDETRRNRLCDGGVFIYPATAQHIKGDARCTGTTLRDFVRSSDLERLPEDQGLEYETSALAVTG